MSTTLIFVGMGYSQMRGSATALTDPTIPSPNPYYPIVGSDIWMLGIDGGFRPASEPMWDPAREASGGFVNHTADTAATSSALGPALDAIRSGGETRCLLGLPCAADGYQSAGVNTPSGGLTADWTTISTIMGQRIRQAMRFPNPLLGGVFLSTALGDAAAEAAAPGTIVQPNLANWCNNVNALVTSIGLSWAKNTHFLIGRLQNPNAVAFNGGDVTAVNNALDALDAARADTLLVQEPVGSISGQIQQHLTYAARLTWGQLFGTTWLAAP